MRNSSQIPFSFHRKYWVFVTVIKQWILKSLLDELGVVTHNSSCGRNHN
jgi:hypothetical protein